MQFKTGNTYYLLNFAAKKVSHLGCFTVCHQILRVLFYKQIELDQSTQGQGKESKNEKKNMFFWERRPPIKVDFWTLHK